MSLVTDEALKRSTLCFIGLIIFEEFVEIAASAGYQSLLFQFRKM
jgi:hypothetical protein